MRVISQNGEIDFPYEQIVVQRNENIVLAIPVSNGALTNVLGNYGTPEKAEKAMKMLHDCYTGCLWTESHYDTAAQANVSDIVVKNVVFQFSQDIEVEV